MDSIADNFVQHNASSTFATYLAGLIKKNGQKTIGIFGPSGGGKTTFARQLLSAFGEDIALLISVDDYWCYTREQMKEKGLTGYDWEARDKKRFFSDLSSLQHGLAIDKPLQDYTYEKPADHTERIEPKEIIILEATLDFTSIADVIIFTYAPDEIIFNRRIERDRYKKAFPSLQALENYVREKSIPAYKQRLIPLVSYAHFAIDTHANVLYKNKNISF